MSAQTPVPGLPRGFFEDYLAAQRDVSQNTIYAYRDACKLFLRFAARHRGRQLIRLQLADPGAGTVLAFLTYLESGRKNSAATRNCRLVAIHTAMKRKAIERCPPLVPDPEGESRWHASKDIIQWPEDL